MALMGMTSVLLLVAVSAHALHLHVPQWLAPWMPTIHNTSVSTDSPVFGTSVHPFLNDVPAEQRLKQAQLALRAGENSRARYLAVTAVTEMSSDDAHYAYALDLAGYASWVAGSYKEAVTYLALADETSPDDVLSPWRRTWLADASMRLGHSENAVAWADRVVDTPPMWSPIFIAEAARTRALATQEEQPDPTALANFLTAFPEYPQARDAWAELALAWARLGDFTQASTVFENMEANYPWAPQAGQLRQHIAEHAAWKEEISTPTLQERLDRVRIWRRLRQWPSVVSELHNMQRDLKNENKKTRQIYEGPILYELAMNAMEEGDYALAEQHFSALQHLHWRGVSQEDGLKYQGWNLSRMGRREDALRLIRKSIGLRPAKQRILEEFEYTYDFGLFCEAKALHDKLPRTNRLEEFRQIMLGYLCGEHETARRDFERRADRLSGHDSLQSRYWAGRAAFRAGDVDAAKAHWTAVVAANPTDYYGLLAVSRLQDIQEKEATDDEHAPTYTLRRLPGYVHWRGDEDSEPATFHHVVAHPIFITAYDTSLVAPTSLHELVESWSETFPSLPTIEALFELGADEEARYYYRQILREVNALRTSNRRPSATTPVSLQSPRWGHWIDNRRGDNKKGWWGTTLDEPLFPSPNGTAARTQEAKRQQFILDQGETLTQALVDIGRHIEAHHMVRQLVLRNRRLGLNPPQEGSLSDWLEAYPRPYPASVVTHTRRAELNPYLLWAMIIVESNMCPDAISHADAYGLTQVIPKTGDRLAWEFGDRSFGIHALLDPHVSIRYGARYLGALVHKFHGQESLALVGYNAGPHRVARWLDWRGDRMDADEFLEMVPFRGARGYHQNILRFLAIYQLLYEGELRLYIGLDLNTSYQEAWNF